MSQVLRSRVSVQFLFSAQPQRSLRLGGYLERLLQSRRKEPPLSLRRGKLKSALFQRELSIAS